MTDRGRMCKPTAAALFFCICWGWAAAWRAPVPSGSSFKEHSARWGGYRAEGRRGETCFDFYRQGQKRFAGVAVTPVVTGRRTGTIVLWSTLEKEETAPSAPAPGRGGPGGPIVARRVGKRAQRLKDLILNKQLRKDITTAEFALKLDLPTQPEKTLGQIDYEALADKLEKSLELIDRRQGRLTATGQQSTADLTKRLNETKRELEGVLHKIKESMGLTDESGQLVGHVVVDFEAMEEAAAAAAAAGVGEGADKTLNPFTVFVREDGTVDWDGALQSGKELAKFSGDLFKRLSGSTPGEEAPQSKVNTLAAIDRSNAISPLHDLLSELEEALRQAKEERNRLRDYHRALRTMGMEVTKEQKTELRLAEDQVVELRRRVELQRLDLEMERICVYIEQEIEQSTSFREQKLLVAEFGLLDSQLTTLLTMLQDAELDPSSLLELDEDELKVVSSEVQDLKTRLGLVEDPGFKIDLTIIDNAIRESVGKIRSGVTFYVAGTKLLVSDIQYATWLISRAAQGYTLKPREVRTLRRTAKDLLTVIPFTIILIIPMTPIGHVLVFSLIQRIFPGFFPSTFTDRRQNLSKMYEEIEKKPLASAIDGGSSTGK